MFLCIKGAEVYAPEYQGKADVLVCNEKVIHIAPQIETSVLPGQVKVIQAEGLKLLPGLIDQHVHITGGGGESRFYQPSARTALLTDYRSRSNYFGRIVGN